MPKLTPIELAALVEIGPKERPGKAILEGLKDRGVKMSGPSFYYLMAQLQERGMVKMRSHEYTSMSLQGSSRAART